MRIGIGSDFDGLDLKDKLKSGLAENHTVRDFCTSESDPPDYRNVTDSLALALRAGNIERGLLISSCAIGASVAANKHSRVRAAFCHEPDIVRRGVEDEQLNFLVIRARAISEGSAFALMNAFLDASPIQPASMCGIHPRLLARVIEHIRDNLDAALSVGELADLVGMSESHFSKLFKRDTGVTPHQFILNERINCSKELLQSGISRLVDIALDVGFQNQAHFTTVFRNVVGVTPGQFQRLAGSRLNTHRAPQFRERDNDEVETLSAFSASN